MITLRGIWAKFKAWLGVRRGYKIYTVAKIYYPILKTGYDARNYEEEGYQWWVFHTSKTGIKYKGHIEWRK